MPEPGGPGSGRFCIGIDATPPGPPGPLTTPKRGGSGACRLTHVPGIGGVGAGLCTGDGLFLKINKQKKNCYNSKLNKNLIITSNHLLLAHTAAYQC